MPKVPKASRPRGKTSNDGPMPDRVVSPKMQQEELALDLSLRPKRLDEYIGQDKVTQNVRILIEAAKARGEAIDHVLLYGPPGLGKCITLDSLKSSASSPDRRRRDRAV